MAIDLFWDDDEQSVLLAEFNGKWTWDELHRLIRTVKRLAKEKDKILGAIIDLRQGMHMPDGNILSKEGLNQFKRLLSLNDNDEQKGPVVVLGVNGIVKRVFDAIKTIDKSVIEDVEFASDETHARDLIYKALARVNNSTSA